MKFLTFVDLHGDKKELKDLVKRTKQEDIDFVVCAGDLSNFAKNIKDLLQEFEDCKKKFYMIPGNHEEPFEAFEDVLKGFDFCENVHKKSVEIGDYVFLFFGGGGFTQEDAEFRKVARGWYSKYKGKKIVLVTHQPPYGTKTDNLDGHHVGSKDYVRFVNRINPKLFICGHIHETAGAMDKIGKTRVIHPGWDGMVIELV